MMSLEKGMPIKGIFSKINEKTGRNDKYICDVFVEGEVSHVVDLE